MYELLNPFVELAFGKQYLFDMPVVLILCINFLYQWNEKSGADIPGLAWIVLV